jgi:chemosensory pili system protein ChpE/L-lysine exporter family protein LysE/ArgO
MSIMTILFAAFLLGLVFNATPGAVFAETVRRGATGGFKAALAVQIGSLVGDATWAVLGLMGVGLLLQVDALKWPVGLVGAAYLIWLSWDSWKAASIAFSVHENQDEKARSGLKSGVILSLTNPQNLAYWAALGSALGALGIADPGIDDYAMFFSGFMMASVTWAVFCAAAIDRIFKKAGQKWVALTYRLCAVMFMLLAVNTVRDLFSHSGPSALHLSPPAVQGANLAAE